MLNTKERQKVESIIKSEYVDMLWDDKRVDNEIFVIRNKYEDYKQSIDEIVYRLKKETKDIDKYGLLSRDENYIDKIIDGIEYDKREINRVTQSIKAIEGKDSDRVKNELQGRVQKGLKRGYKQKRVRKEKVGIALKVTNYLNKHKEGIINSISYIGVVTTLSYFGNYTGDENEGGSKIANIILGMVTGTLLWGILYMVCDTILGTMDNVIGSKIRKVLGTDKIGTAIGGKYLKEAYGINTEELYRRYEEYKEWECNKARELMDYVEWKAKGLDTERIRLYGELKAVTPNTKN